MANATWSGGFAAILIYAESSDEASEISSRIRSEYSTALHALYKAGYNAVMLFSAVYDEEREAFTESSTMIGVSGGLQHALEVQMRKESGSDKMTLAERRANRKHFGKVVKIRLDFGEKSAWFMINGDVGTAKLDGKTRNLTGADIKSVCQTVDMLSLSEWQEDYGGEGEAWLLALEFESGAQFTSKGKGAYPSAFPLALDLYYDFIN
jgi:hypothetical protein